MAWSTARNLERVPDPECMQGVHSPSSRWSRQMTNERWGAAVMLFRLMVLNDWSFGVHISFSYKNLQPAVTFSTFRLGSTVQNAATKLAVRHDNVGVIASINDSKQVQQSCRHVHLDGRQPDRSSNDGQERRATP